MTARVLRFPARGPFAVRIEREGVSGAWLVICRRHGWMFGSFRDALEEAHQIASGFGVAVQVTR